MWGALTLKFDGKNKITSFDYAIIPLTKDIPDDPQIRQLVDEYKKAAKTK
jgi:2',3'-cyclic-nucleotide 2'-phosphodiesterase (5'-nucleotidase family)